MQKYLLFSIQPQIEIKAMHKYIIRQFLIQRASTLNKQDKQRETEAQRGEVTC